MLKTFDIIMILVMISAAAVTFRIKADSEAQLREVRTLERQIAAQDEAIDLLEADWSLLTQPSRVQKLVDAHREQLGLQATNSRQIDGVDAIPEKGLAADESDPIADAIADAEDGVEPKIAKKETAKAKKKAGAEPVDVEIETGSVDE
ncbi:MAG: cell division protein FtsL [Rhizobiaceae bacterium]